MIAASLWYAVDYIYSVEVNQRRSLGFDWHHVYRVKIGALTAESVKYRAEPEHTTAAGNDLLTFLNRLEQHPAVESVCLTDMHKHYQWTNANTNVKIDTLSTSVWYRVVSPGYFPVFRVHGADGSSPEELASKALFTDMMITEQVVSKLFPDGQAIGKAIKNEYSGDSIRISAVVENQKYNEYTSHYRAVYVFFNMNDLASLDAQSIIWLGCYIRVKPEADKGNFVRDFRKEMRGQLAVGNLYLQEMRPVSAIRDEHLKDYRNDLYTYMAVIVFFLLNAFLAVLGTFWSRTQQRRAELGLRLALGSSKKKVGTMLYGEGLLLLTISYLLALLLAWNLGVGELVSTWPVEFTFARFLVSSVVTYLLLVAIVWFGIWYPARQAMKIEPAEALRDE